MPTVLPITTAAWWCHQVSILTPLVSLWPAVCWLHTLLGSLLATSLTSLRAGWRQILVLDVILFKMIRVVSQRDERLAVVAHQLQTSLTALRCSLWLVRHSPTAVLPATALRQLELAESATERLQRLARQLLTTSQLDWQCLPLELVPRRIDQLLQQLIQELQPLASRRQIALRLVVTTDRLWVPVDAGKMTEVFLNILSNAIKFSPAGKEVVTTVGGDQDIWQVSVSDQGPGIAATQQTQLFRKFAVLVQPGQSSGQTGTGLGLYIAAQLTQLHGGTIALNSVVGQGTTVTVKLPRAEHKQVKSTAHRQQLRSHR